MKKIAVIGDIMLDVFEICKFKRSCIEENDIFDLEDTIHRVGGAGNVAVNASILNNDVIMFTSVGNDVAKDIIFSELNAYAVDTSYVVCAQENTTIKSRVLNDDKILFRIDKDCIASDRFEKIFFEKFIHRLIEMDAIIISDYNKGVVTSKVAKEIVSRCKESTIIVDTKKKDIDCFFGVDTLCVTLNEFNIITKKQYKSLESVGDYAFRFLNEFSIKRLIIKNNVEGSILFDLKTEKKYSSCFNAEKKCAIGAGDVFVAVYCAEYLQGTPISEILNDANRYATQSIAKQFTSVIEKE